MDITLETLTLNDLDEMRNLQPETWGDIIPNTRFYIESDFCYAVKAVSYGKIVGSGAAIVGGNAVWISNILVHPDHRNKGIGRLITDHTTEYARQFSSSIILIATKLGYPVYKKLGFQDDQAYIFFKKQKLSLPVPATITPYTAQLKDAILRLDFDTTGEQRERLLTPHLKDSFVYLENDVLNGFTIPSLGEGLTLAINEQAGLDLMVKNLQQEKRVALPLVNKAAIDFLLQNGFEEDTGLSGIKMYFGKYIPWKPLQMYGRVGGNMG